MKLLPRVTSFLKDVAKAVKRISQEEFKEVSDETLRDKECGQNNFLAFSGLKWLSLSML